MVEQKCWKKKGLSGGVESFQITKRIGVMGISGGSFKNCKSEVKRYYELIEFFP